MKDLIVLNVNREQFEVASISELNMLLEKFQNQNFVEYDICGHGETSVVVLMNSKLAMGIFFRFAGDNGFTTYNSKGNDELQDFILSNGQKDEYPTKILVDKQLGFEILKHYFLTGKRYESVEWGEE